GVCGGRALLPWTGAYPELRPPFAVAATVIALLPKPTGTVAEKEPSAAAVVLVTEAGVPVVVSADATVTDAPAVVLPVTVVDVTASVLPLAGAVIVTVSAPGPPWVRYRAVVTAGVSTLRPAASDRISRTSWAWAQVSGDADPAAWPLTNPMEAVAGLLP